MSTNITNINDSTNITLPPDIEEQVQSCIANGKLPLSTKAIFAIIKSKISGGNDRHNDVTDMDVVEVLKTAVSAGIDPTSNDIFAFKSKGTLTVGISKKGWSKILDNRKGSIEYEYGPLIDGKTKISAKQYEYVAAKIIRADGTFVTGPRVYNDEFNTGKGAWQSNPKTMMTVRAFTQACALAYGIGAYDEYEAREIYDKNNSHVNHDRTPQPLPLPSTISINDIDLDEIDSIELLTKRFKALTTEQQNNSVLKDKFTKRKNELLTKFEDIK